MIAFSKTAVTFFHRIDKSDGTEEWYAHVVGGCYVTASDEAAQGLTGLRDADRVTVSVPFEYQSSKLMVGGLEYKDWRTYDAQAVKSGITFREGKDAFVVGALYSINPMAYSEGRESFLDWLRKSHEVYTLTAVKQYGLIPHFEIGGR